LAHNGKLTHFDFSQDERFFVSVGTDLQMKIFDMRNYYKEIDSYYTPSNPVDLKISQTGLTALSLRNQIHFWKGLN
jgi:U3 small nucleolar RNA-associated protein 7